ncbi:MAG: DUF6807 family protein [Terracidiphilus sp.]|jgi:hypothetical protein
MCGYPFSPQPGEREDHRHQVGMWFDYGNVNGFDFWNNSNAIKPENCAKMGSIYQERIQSAKSGSDQGEFTVESVWIARSGEKILDHHTIRVFQGGRRARDRPDHDAARVNPRCLSRR